MITRKGTRVLHKGASASAVFAEVYHDAGEYECYARFNVERGGAFVMCAEPNDHLLIYDERDERLAGMAHVLNLVNGMKAIVPWNAMAHNVKPVA